MLRRSLSIPKESWRELSAQRTLVPINVGQVITNFWKTHHADLPERGSLDLSLQPDGTPDLRPSIHPIQGQQKLYLGVFDFSFIATNRVKVVLRSESCSQLLGAPRRATRQIALLRPWKVVRVLLNGRMSSYSGQTYRLQEYHLALCAGSMPDGLEPTRFVDLQADLM